MDSAQSSLDPLPTTPIGKQQVIDLNAGAILRKEGSRKSSKIYGCNPAVLLVIVMLLKSIIIAGWLYREYHYFDYGCPFVKIGGAEYVEEEQSEYLPVRAKRSPLMDNYIVNRPKGQKKNRPVLGGSPALTTMVTMTNLQELPSANSSAKIKMKTIRQRVEEVRKPNEDVYEISMEDYDEPTIYIAPIQSRFDPMIDDSMLSTVATTKAKKRKGKGKKKKNKTTPAPTTTEATTTTARKKKKGMGRKKLKNQSNRVPSEQTKSPRHLMAPVGQTSPTTKPPHKDSFVNGVIAANGEQKGHIRGFHMKKATKKPKSGIKLSQETRLMWEMDELNYTTQIMQVKTTEMTKEKEEQPSFVENQPYVPQATVPPKTTDAPTPVRDFYSSHTTTWSKKTDRVPPTVSPVVPYTTAGPVVVELRPENAVPRERETPTQSAQPVAIYYETVIEPPRKPLESTLAQLERASDRRTETYDESEGTYDDPHFIYPTPPPRKIKHGFDRSLDDKIDSGMDVLERPTTPPKQREIEDEDGKDRFQYELQSFTSNAICMIRTFFDTWCGCQIFTTLPYLIGICVGKRNFFVTHLLCDIFFLGAGFLCSVTLLALSIILYVSVDEMTTSEFIHWLLFVAIIEVLLMIYTFIVYRCYQCSERIIVTKQQGYTKDYTTGVSV